jgi:hypothetical protein
MIFSASLKSMKRSKMSRILNTGFWIQQDYADLTGSGYATQLLGDQSAKFNAFSS